MNASDKQINYLASLIRQSRFANETEARAEYGITHYSELSSYDASGMIGWLKAENSGQSATFAAAVQRESGQSLVDRALRGDADARAQLGLA